MNTETPFRQTSIVEILGGRAGASPPGVAPGNPVPPPIRGGTSTDVELAPGVASQLLTGEVGNQAASAPLGDSQRGNLFKDRNDPGLTWYLPAFVLVNPDTAFAFAADQTSIDAQGNPYNQATLTLHACTVDPPDVQQLRQQHSDARLQQIPFMSLGAMLSLPYKDGNGTDQLRTVNGEMRPLPDGTFQIVFSGLLGTAVIHAYEQLSELGGAMVEFQLTYRVWQHSVMMRPEV